MKVLIVADDMTGANDTGALFGKNGFSAITAIRPENTAALRGKTDVVCLSTDSRAMLSENAEDTVFKAVKDCWLPGSLVCKRIDSTLRGNVGSEINGMLKALPEDYKAIVVPSCPEAGRICVGGHVLVNGTALAKSSAAEDKKTPVIYSRVEDIIRQQNQNECRTFWLQDVQKGADCLTNEIKACEAKIMIFDAVTQEDIESIAKACVDSKISFICVDPGRFSFETARYRFEKVRKQKKEEANLLVIGSIYDVTRKQVTYLEQRKQTETYTVHVDALISEYEMEKSRLLKEIEEREKQKVQNICLITQAEPIPLTIEEAECAAERLAQIGIEILKKTKKDIRCAYLSGGDVARYFLKELQADALDLKDEVCPLAVYGKVIGGTWNGLQILTKGGMVGSEETLYQMLNYAEQQRRKDGKDNEKDSYSDW